VLAYSVYNLVVVQAFKVTVMDDSSVPVNEGVEGQTSLALYSLIVLICR